MYASIEDLLASVRARDPGETEFHQAVEGVFSSLWPFLAANPRYSERALIERFLSPERVIRSPRNPYTQALVSVSPSPDPPGEGEQAQRTILVGETPDAAHIPAGCRFHPRCPLAVDRCKV